MVLTQANTYGALTAISTYLSSVQVNSQPAFLTVETGVLKQIKDNTPCAMVFLGPREVRLSEKGSIGGKVHECQTYHILSVVDFTDAPTAEQQIANIADGVLALFEQRVRLGDIPTVFSSLVKQSQMQFGFMSGTDGVTWRTHEFDLEVVFEYFVPVGPGTA